MPRTLKNRDEMIKFEIDYFEDKSVKSYVALKNGIQFGPKLVFHDTSNVKSCESEYSAPFWYQYAMDRFWKSILGHVLYG